MNGDIFAKVDYNATEWLSDDELEDILTTDAYNIVKHQDDNGKAVFFLRNGKAYGYGWSTLNDLWTWCEPEYIIRDVARANAR